MRVNRRALGQWYPGEGVQSASCGANPCSFSDYLFVSDACAAWLQCAGQPAVTFSNVLAQGAGGIASGAVTVAGGAVSGATSNVTTDIVLLIAAVALVGVLVMVKS